MPDRDRSPRTSTLVAIVVVAVFVGAAISGYGGWAQLQSQRDSDRRSGHYTKSTYYPAYNACLSKSGAEKTNCIAEAHEAYRVNQRDERDLVAQETTAAWTLVMSTAAIFGIILSVVGVALVWGTFRETRRTNEIARLDGRPWVDFKVSAISNLQFPTSTSDRKSILFFPKMNIRNWGRSPAIDVRYTLAAYSGHKIDFGKVIRDTFSSGLFG